MAKTYAATGINSQINFQGKVVNKTAGTNVTNGDYDFTFRLYDAASGGSLLWTENHTGANDVTVTDGIFRVALGSITSLSTVDFNSDSIYLDITFNGEAMGSRIRFASVPYAFNAEKVNGLTVTNNGGNTLNIAANKTFTVNNSVSITADDGSTLTFQGTDTYVGRTTTDTLTNKTIGSTGLVFSGATTDITTGTNEDLIISPNGTGRTGIGTTNTSSTNSLAIGGASGTLIRLYPGTGLISESAVISLNSRGSIGYNGTSQAVELSDADATKPLLFLTANGGSSTERMRIGTDGNVNIGADSTPNALFTVGSTSQFQVNSSGAIAAATGLTLTSGAITLGGSTGSGQCLVGGASAAWGSCGSGSSSNWVLSTANGTLSPINNTLDLLLGGTSTTSAKFAVINMNSGVPTATMGASFSISATQNGSGSVNFNALNGNDMRFRVSPGGDAGVTTALYFSTEANVGIGNTSPRAKLDITGSASMSGNLTLRGTGNNDLNLLNNSSFRIRNSVGGDAGLSTAFIVTNTGNVGIGDTSPLSLFTVGSGDAFQVNSSGAIAASTGITTSGGYTQSGTSSNTFTGATTISSAATNALILSGAATTAINISNTSITTDINLQNGATIDNNSSGTLNVEADTFQIKRPSGGSTSPDLYITSANEQNFRISTNFNNVNYNSLVQAGDHGIIFDNGSQGTGNLVIGPWSNSSVGGNGLRMTNEGTTFFRSNSNGLATVSIDQAGTNDIITASASGTTVFKMNNGGTITMGTGSDILDLDELEFQGSEDWIVSQGGSCAGAVRLCFENNAGFAAISFTPAGQGRAAVGFTTNTPDYAENINIDDQSIEAGDIVSVYDFNPNEQNIYRKSIASKSKTEYDNYIIGAISENPGFLATQGNAMTVQDRGWDDHERPFAVAGRVGIKVTTSNGDIKVGDRITSSDIPGVGMKATKAGRVVGIAMEDYSNSNTSEVKKILVFINPQYFIPDVILTNSGDSAVGKNIKNEKEEVHVAKLLEENLDLKVKKLSESNGLTLTSVNKAMNEEKIMLDYLFDNQKNSTNSADFSDVFGNNIAGLEIIKPNVANDEIALNDITSLPSNDLNIKLNSGKFFNVNNNNLNVIAFDSSGNATFSATLKSKSVETENIIANQLSVLNLALNQNATISGSLRVKNESTFEELVNFLSVIKVSKLIVSGVSTFIDEVNFKGNIKLNNNYGGYAVIEKGQKEVNVVFERSFDQDPIINSNLIIDEDGDYKDEEFFKDDYRYYITNVSPSGFEIKLNKSAANDLKFSWSAVNIDKPNISKNEASKSALLAN